MTETVKKIRQYIRGIYAMFRRNQEVIFSAQIEYNDEEKGHISKDSRSNEISFEKLDSEARKIICQELPSDLDKIYGIKADIRYIDSREGSLIIFFGAMITTYGLIANYKDFFESIRLIKEHGQRLLKTLERRLHIPPLSIYIKNEYPELPHPDSMRYSLRLKHLFHMFPPDIAEMILEKRAYDIDNYSKRDGFFWYLIFMNIILIITLGALVAAAVIKVYF
jgi:hypothetical protein